VAVSVLQIEVQDEDFKSFVNRFDEYKASVEKLPAQWQDVTTALSEHGTHLDAIANALSAIEQHTKTMAEHQQGFSRATESSGRSMSSLARSTVDVARHIKEATESLLKWATVTELVGGLLGAGGIWGIDRLAQSAGSKLRSAQGVGVTTGEADAMRINYGRYLDTDHLLSNIADAKSDYSKRWIFSALGIGEGELNNEDPATLATDVMSRAKRMYLNSDRSQQFVQAHGLDQLFSQEDLRRLAAGDLNQSQQDYEQDKAALTLPPKDAKAWQDFDVQMERAGVRIERTFIEGLIPLEGPLAQLSVAFTKAVESLMANPHIKEWIGDLATGIKHFADYLNDPNGFTADLGHFEDAVVKLWHMLENVVTWIEGKFGPVKVVNQTPGEGPGDDPNTVVNGEKLSWYAQHPEVVPPAAQNDPAAWYAAHPAAVPAGRSVDQAPYDVPAATPKWYQERFEIPPPTPADDYRRLARAAGVKLTGVDAEGRKVTDPFYNAATDPDRRDEFFAQEYGANLPAGLLANVYKLESDQGRNPSTSPAGAKGDFQFTDDTAKDYPGGQSLDPQEGATAAADYLRDLIKHYHGDVTEALAAYNDGPGNIDADIAAHHKDWRKFLPAETKHYIDYAQRGIGDFRQTSSAKSAGQAPVKVQVDVNNPAGAQVAVSGSQLVGVPR
jgi:soluble lytic murein transglycosylase-like protein